METTAVYRYEKKYLIDECDAQQLANRMQPMLLPDTHSCGKYHISSLYFDDHYSASFYQKQNGALVRNKFRARFYNHAMDLIRLECKHKHGEMMCKTDFPLTIAGYNSMCQGNYSFLLDCEDETARKFYARHTVGRMRPSVMVEYDRAAFVYGPGNVRITFDSDITASAPGGQGSLRVLPQGLLVLEVKYDHFLPSVVAELLSGFTLTQMAISKFVLCEYMLHNEHRLPITNELLQYITQRQEIA